MLSLLLSGCFEINAEATIKKDGTTETVVHYDFSEMTEVAKSAGRRMGPAEMPNCKTTLAKLVNRLDYACKDTGEGKFDLSRTFKAGEGQAVVMKGSEMQVDVVQLFAQSVQNPEKMMGKWSGKNEGFKLPSEQEVMAMHTMGVVLSLTLKLPGKLQTVDGDLASEEQIEYVANTGYKIDMLDLADKKHFILVTKQTSWTATLLWIGGSVFFLLVFALVLRKILVCRRKPKEVVFYHTSLY